MNRQILDRLMQRLAETETEELSCSECFELLAMAVDVEVSATTPGVIRTRLDQHLNQCGVCREEFEVLRDFVRSEGRQ